MKNMQLKRVLAVMLTAAMAMPSPLGAIPRSYATELVLDEPIELQSEQQQNDVLELQQDQQQQDVIELGDKTEDSELEVVTQSSDSIEPAVTTQADPSGLTDFTSPNGSLDINADEHTVRVTDNNDNHYAVYQGLQKKANDFVFEADVKDVTRDGVAGVGSAALIYAIGKKNAPGAGWSGANFDTTRGGDDVFRMWGPGYENMCGTADGVDFTQPIHLKLEIHKNGEFTYEFGNVGGQMRQKTGTIPNWGGGYVGLLTWDSEATFYNVSFVDNTVEDPTQTVPFDAEGNFNTNLSGFSYLNGEWEVTESGLRSNAVDKGDAFMYSSTSASNFVYSTDVTFYSPGGAAALLFRSQSSTSHKSSYAVNLDNGSKACKFWRWTDGEDSQLINERTVEASPTNTYTLKVVAIDNWISYYVNDVLVASSGDYTLQPDDRGQDTSYFDGCFGLLNWNGDVVFQNTYYTPLQDDLDPRLTNIAVTSDSGTVEEKGQFSPGEPITIQYVKHDASTVNVTATPKNGAASVVVRDAEGNEYADGKNIPVGVGKNYIDVVSTVEAEHDVTASLTYRVNVHRRQQDAIYYNEPYRDQYHFSVKDGWGNDPNGLVYYKGTYHFFYQFYDDTVWGPMHWGHATSKDLVHWEEQPMALYPDANGAMFSGCIVADETNVSGLFSSDEGGLVALITADGNGQRIKLAYSEDEGKTWTKVDKIAADWSRDPLGSMDFRDPKVFRWQNTWFMVIAGGPLRIYSSTNLRDWKCESTYYNLHTECPDLYPIQAEDNAIKWVLSRGGRKYKVGDFTQVNGNWTFVPDADYSDPAGSTDGIMNFGKDSYAAMTFYVQDFGTAQQPSLPDIIEINWMNTWDDYCNAVADKVGQQFNGTYNLTLREGLKKDGDKYVLTQTPIDSYKDLRIGAPVVDVSKQEVGAQNTLLDDFAGSVYEIESTFYPAEGTTKVGFQLRVGDDEHTDVMYDVADQRLSIDRSQSGTQISGRFSDVDSQVVTPNADGSVTMHIFMDRASVEVFSQGYTVAGANQIFPSLDSNGAKVIVEGEPAKADIKVYALDDIWDKANSDEPLAIQALTPTKNSIYAGDKTSLKVALLPITVDQSITWGNDNPDVALLEIKGATAKVTGLKKGTATITATSTAKPELSKTFTVNVLENNFQTNLDGFVNVTGNWIVDDITLSDDSRASNDFYMGKDPINAQEYTMSTKVKFTRGLPNIFFAAKSTNPFDGQAYALQLNDGTHVRLFRFAGDTLAEGEMGKHVNDDQYHDILITKKKDSVQVAVDGNTCLDYKFDGVEDYYNGTPYVGLGLWDGYMEVQTLYVNPIEEPKPEPVKVTAPKGKQLTYTGKKQTGVQAADGYTLSGATATNAGDYVATATLADGFVWSDGTTEPKKIAWSIAKAANTLEASAKESVQTATYNPAKTTTLAANVAAEGAQGKVTFANASSNKTAKTFKVNASTGKVGVTAGTNAGTYKVVVSVKAAGDANHNAAAKKVSFKVKVARASIKNATVANVSNKAYTGKKITPSPKVTLDGVTLKKTTDYNLTYANNVKAGTAKIKASGVGNYTGTTSTTFKIVAPSSTVKVLGQDGKWKKASKTSPFIGTVGQTKGLEGIALTIRKNFPVSGGITYRSHVQNKGWEQTWSSDGQVSGVAGKRVEAVRIKLTGDMAKKYDVYYRVHCQHFSWMGWAKNGASAGTSGYAYRLEALQIAYVPKGGAAPATNYQRVEQVTAKAYVAK
ncbi:MAG: GH32 C-terminal domain-containing protein [Coriobacteriales bacterium]|nr:GH32 C-terminal domain-containing protein [Coriobacteriales bacterium]